MIGLFYLDKPEKAIDLICEQLTDGWSENDIQRYWWCLGYDVFWYSPLIIEAKKRSLNVIKKS